MYLGLFGTKICFYKQLILKLSLYKHLFENKTYNQEILFPDLMTKDLKICDTRNKKIYYEFVLKIVNTAIL